MAEFQKPPPLDIKCTSTDCDNDLHCFKQLKKMTPDQRGKCRACGANLIDWKRLHRRDRGDAAHTFEALQHEMIRHHFFHRPVDDAAMMRSAAMFLPQAVLRQATISLSMGSGTLGSSRSSLGSANRATPNCFS